ELAQAPLGLYRDVRYAEYLRLTRGADDAYGIAYRGENLRLTLSGPGVYCAGELASAPGFPLCIGFKSDALVMALGGEVDRFAHVPDWAPGDLSHWAGVYWSEEAQAHLTLSMRDGVLVSQFAGRTAPLTPGKPGEFSFGRGALDVPMEGPADHIIVQIFG